MRSALVALVVATAAFAGDADRALLEANGIAPDARSLGAYLEGLVLGEKERSAALSLVRGLGSEDPLERHETLLQLSALRAPALDAMREAAASDDPEVRRAGARLLEEALRRVRKDLLIATLRTIAEGDFEGLAGPLLAVAPLAHEKHLSPWVTAALRATVAKTDLAALREAAAGRHAETRYVAVRALGTAPGAGPDEALPWLEADDERMRLAAALALADRGDGRCLGPLLALLDATAFAVRRDAAHALRWTCDGGGLGYDAYADAAARAPRIDAWRRWIGARPADANLRHPLPVGPRKLGRTLISLYTQGRVVEVDEEGRRTFEARELGGAWANQGLPNGHRLIALHMREEIVEYDEEGVQIGRLKLPGRPQGFQRLENGNTLVAIAEQRRIVEIAPDTAVVREWTVRGQPADVKLLDNGNLLVTLMRPASVIELNGEGRTVWSLGGLNHVSMAQRLDNGNTLVAETAAGRAAEYDRAGNVVWERQGLQVVYTVERLADGATLVADQSGVREIATDGSERWLMRTDTFSRASRY